MTDQGTPPGGLKEARKSGGRGVGGLKREKREGKRWPATCCLVRRSPIRESVGNMPWVIFVEYSRRFYGRHNERKRKRFTGKYLLALTALL